MKTQETNKSTTASDGCSHVEIATIGAITQSFLERELESQRKKEFGQLEFLNSLNALFVVSKAIAANYEYETFSFNDFVTYAKPFDLPIEIQRQFFNDWIEELQKAGRVQAVETCYDH